MRVLITGVDGFVGSHAAEFLLTKPGVDIHGLVLDPTVIHNITHIASSLHLHQGDILDAASIDSLIREIRPDRIIHLAGQAYVPSAFENPVATFNTNIFGGITVLEAARKCLDSGKGAPAVLVVSTGEVYGKVDPSRQPITELLPLSPHNPYAASKASLDLIAQQYARAFGLKVTVVRPLNHAGPRQSPAFVCSDFGRQIAEIEAGIREPVMYVGNTEVRRDFTDVRDVVRAYWLLFDRPSSDIVFNVCSGQAIQISEILSLLQEISQQNVKIVSEQRRLRAYDVPLVIGSFDRLHSATGWSPQIPLRKTLQDVFSYWQEELSRIA